MTMTRNFNEVNAKIYFFAIFNGNISKDEFKITKISKIFSNYGFKFILNKFKMKYNTT